MNDKGKELLTTTRGFQTSCVLGAACELDLFTAILRRSQAPTTQELAAELELDFRGLDVLATALISLEILEKTNDGRLRVADDCADALDSASPESVVAMIRHQTSCLRAWSQLAWAVKSGVPAPKLVGINGPTEEYRSFIAAMNVVGKPFAAAVSARMADAQLLGFKRLLDLGGASGTYSFAFLEKNPDPTARAIIFDVPIAIQEARQKLAGSPFAERVELVAGDFYVDEFPSDVDFVWISAIVHQQDDAATEEMFRKSRNALRPGGRVAIRDIFLNADRTGPKGAAFFGVNMLANTKKGKVYEVDEIIGLLTKVGFKNARLALPAEDMSAVIVAEK